MSFFVFASYAQHSLDSLKQSLNKGNLDSKFKTLTILNEEYSNSDLKKAMFYGNEALQTAKLLKNEAYIALSYNMIANIFQYETQLDSSLTYHNKSLFLRKKLKDSIGMADSYNNIGILYDTKGQFSKALNYYFKALYFYDKKGDVKKQAMSMTNIGIIYKAQKEYTKALKYYQKAYDLYVESKSEFEITISSGNLGSILINFQKYKESLYYSELAISGYKKLGYKRYVAYPMESIAIVYDSLHQFEKANKNYIEAIRIHEENDNLFEVAQSANAYSNCLIKQNKCIESIAIAEKAKAFAQKSNSYMMEVLANDNLSRANAKLGNYKEAYVFSALYDKGKDSLFVNEKTKTIFELETKYQTEKKEKLILEQKAETEHKSNLLWAVSVLAFFIALTGFLIYRQQKLKNFQQDQEFQLKTAIQTIESQNTLHEQRLNISKDLHDNIGAQLTFIISSVDNIKYAFDITNPKLNNKLNGITNFTKDTIVELRDTIWAMNHNEITFEDLKSRIYNFIEKAKESKENIDFVFNIDEQLSDVKFSSVVGMNIYRTIQEAINNAIKHSNATQVTVQIKNEQEQILIQILDNGNGFDLETVSKNNGLTNMENRIDSINGIFKIESNPDLGTKISILLNKTNA